MTTELAEQVPINVSGSSKFGIWPKINLEKTYNMYMSDGWMVGTPGYRKRALANLDGEGRALFRSVRGGFLIAIVGSAVFRIGADLAPQFIANIETITGECFIDENLASQICIVDGKNAYIYFYSGTTGSLTKQISTASIIPGYVSFHATYFLIASTVNSPNRAQWYSFKRTADTTIGLQSTQSISTKPDTALAVRRIPGRGNSIIVIGETVAEVWSFVGADTVDTVDRTYVRINSYNIDNGCISISTIAAGEDTIAWLAVNEANSPVIMVTNGSETKQISTDGIDHLMESIKHPEQSTAFFYRLNGHLFYQLTFFNAEDNLTLLHDFTNGQFFHLSDENLNYHIARDIVYFNNKSYFISLNDASIYEIGDEFDTYNYSKDDPNAGLLIPRIRICKPIRKVDSSTFRCGMFTFWIEQGVNKFFSEEVCDGQLITEITEQPIITESGKKILGESGFCTFEDNRPRVDMSFSKNGNQSFSNIVSKPLNEMSDFRNQIRWHRIGQANEMTIQLRFWGFNRFVVSDGIAEIY